eukprot:GFUD01004421.1.p1 GENE.GFUD01004421.1~~GFUD01004421.1.p1  ORF type:complete len:752 (-),score=167.38 GFUD01004421.1:178-2433(-)
MGSQSLPQKEAAAFKRLMKCHEDKQYKNGLRFAKQILGNSKTADHGETLAVKGLLLLGLGKKDEALDSVKKGLKSDLKSHVCWHAYGLINRSERKYEEAIKCFRNALRFDPENLQVLRDLSVLQIHTRDLEGYRDSRHQMFQLKPTQRASWSGLAMSYHLAGDFDMAVHILEEFRKSQKNVNRDLVGHFMKKMFNKKNDYDYEHSELLLYQSMVLQESGDLSGALKHLEEYEEGIFDKIKVFELKGKLNFILKNYEEATKIYGDLIERNQENSLYFTELVATKQLESNEDIINMYTEFKEKYPKSRVIKVLLLKALTGSGFESELDLCLKIAIRKGVSSILKELSFIYSDTSKLEVLQNLLLQYVANLKKHSSFDDTSPNAETPSSMLWSYYLLANHFDNVKQYDEALPLINLAIDHTPTVVELYMLKAKILKHSTDPYQAVQSIKEAQTMDASDRYVGSKCAKYMLRAGQIEEAVEMMGNFTKPGEEPLGYLDETQCTWFMIEMALAYKKQGNIGEALKQCFEVKRYFEEVSEDQLDFHLFSMSRMRLCAYVDLLRLEDSIIKYGFYEKAAHIAVHIYLAMHDGAKTETVTNGVHQSVADLNESELRKMKNKAKKAKRKEQEAKTKAETKPKIGNSKKMEDEPEKPAKKVFDAQQLAKTTTPLNEAINFLKPLQELLGDRIETHLAAFEIFYRKEKTLLMLQAAKRAHIIDKKHPKVIENVKKYNDYVSCKKFQSTVQSVLEANDMQIIV